ncbi:helix-turn-helix domain-containing protein [Clostridium estertheticum]|uniref:helix-turn-helix domain-containing protein n=1 Tax=Clostridium estertheticum TaxID=238834 RepID=UPI001C7CDE4B|nr:helix-turn-helix transcriptional regulator [Clostridium estertheticum]MBX4271458.1 helix-turn-helix transcriptional regulator [Clostridium estertheticum]WLC81011.1 helix-turn-helix transcriptional regulator [Clostridium estertheticum]
MLDYRQLKHLRLLHNLSQADIAKELGISRNYISMVESHDRTYSKEWHDNYVKTIYTLHMRNIALENEVKEVIEVAEESMIEEVEKIEVVKEIKPIIDVPLKKKVVPKKTTAKKVGRKPTPKGKIK